VVQIPTRNQFHMNKNNESWNEQSNHLQKAQDIKNAEKYGYREGFIPIISLDLIKKIICWFKKKK
jgi:hypothetical protein